MTILSLAKELENILLHPDDEQLQANLVTMLKNSELNSSLWFALDRILGDSFKADVEVVNLDMNAFYNWFNTNLYPKIIANGGNFHFEDTANRTCSVADLKAIIHQDFTNYKQYITDYFDCENFAQMLKHRLAYVYGITACAEIWVMGAEFGHAWNMFIPPDISVQCIEPQNDELWGVSQPREGIYDINRLWFFGM